MLNAHPLPKPQPSEKIIFLRESMINGKQRAFAIYCDGERHTYRIMENNKTQSTSISGCDCK